MSGFIYEVSLFIETTIEKEYLLWLGEHIDEMLSLGCFDKAWVMEEQGSLPSDQRKYRVFYHFREPNDFEIYEKNWASEMRGKMPVAFAGKISFERKILGPISNEKP